MFSQYILKVILNVSISLFIFLITYLWICHHADNDMGLIHLDPTVTWKKNSLKEMLLKNIKYHQSNHVRLLWMNCFLIHKQYQCFVGIKVEIGLQNFWIVISLWHLEKPFTYSLNIFYLYNQKDWVQVLKLIMRSPLIHCIWYHYHINQIFWSVMIYCNQSFNQWNI